MKLFNSLALALLIFMLPSVCFSQATKINFGIGYNVGSHVKNDGLDFVIGRYNSTRSYLTTKMKTPSLFRGMSYSMDVFLDKIVMDFDWTCRKSDVYGEGPDVSGLINRRDFRYMVNSWNFGFAKKLGKESGIVGKYLGMDFSTISIKNYTRVYVSNGSKPSYKRINWDLSVGFSPYLQLVGKRFTIKAYYQFMVMRPSYWDVNRAINPNTWYNDDYDNNKGKTSSVGICLRYNLSKNAKS